MPVHALKLARVARECAPIENLRETNYNLTHIQLFKYILKTWTNSSDYVRVELKHAQRKGIKQQTTLLGTILETP